MIINRRVAASILVVVLVGVTVFASLLYFRIIELHLGGPGTLKLGDEVKDYPIAGLATSFTYWKNVRILSYNTPGLGAAAETGNTFIVFNYTLHNIGNTEINFFTQDVSSNILQVEMPMLRYRSYYASATVFVGDLSWIGNLYFDQPVRSGAGLMPGGHTVGMVAYKILEGYEPIELVYPNADSPKFVMRVSS